MPISRSRSAVSASSRKKSNSPWPRIPASQNAWSPFSGKGNRNNWWPISSPPTRTPRRRRNFASTWLRSFPTTWCRRCSCPCRDFPSTRMARWIAGHCRPRCCARKRWAWLLGRVKPQGKRNRAPQNEIERALFEIVASALNAPSLGMEDNLFEFGAHSLIVAQIVATIRHRLHLPAETKDVFEHPTVASLAELISRRAAAGAVDLATIPIASRHEPIPLTFQQEQIWFLSKLAPDLRAYNCQWTIRLNGDLDRVVLERCFSEIIRRHEILRTTFHEQDGAPVQVIHPPWNATIIERDIRYLPASERETEVERLIGEESGNPVRFLGSSAGSLVPLSRGRCRLGLAPGGTSFRPRRLGSLSLSEGN